MQDSWAVAKPLVWLEPLDPVASSFADLAVFEATPRSDWRPLARGGPFSRVPSLCWLVGRCSARGYFTADAGPDREL